MLLSIVITSYKNQKYLDLYLKKFIKNSRIYRDLYDCELIVIIDGANVEEIKLLEKYRKIIKNIKVIINSARLGKANCYFDAIKVALGKYIFLTSVSDSFKPIFISEIIRETEANNPELIEFKIAFKGGVHWTPEINIVTESPINISQNPKILLDILPIELNKIWNTKFLVQNWKTLCIDSNSRFSIFNFFTILPNVKKYVFINKTLIHSYFEKGFDFSTLPIFRSWEGIIAHYDNYHPELKDELFYVYIYHTRIFLMVFALATKNEVILKKQFNLLVQDKQDKKFDILTNNYLKLETRKTKLINTFLTSNFKETIKLLKKRWMWRV